MNNYHENAGDSIYGEDKHSATVGLDTEAKSRLRREAERPDGASGYSAERRSFHRMSIASFDMFDS
jgi:hypothetical protein